MARSKGSLEFAKRCGNQQARAASLEVSQSTLSLWISGQRKPIEARRIQLEQPEPVGCGIPRGWWDEPVPSAPAPQAPERPLPETMPQVRDEVVELAREFIIAARQTLVNAQDPGMDPREQAGTLRAASPTISALGKLVGIMLELSAEQIVKAPAFAMVLASIVEALRPYPEARDAVIAALERAQPATEKEPEPDAGSGTEGAEG